MTTPSSQEITQMLRAWGQGDQAAVEAVLPLVYDELHRMARRYLARRQPGHTLQPTVLLHEAYLKLADQKGKVWSDRAHFFAVAARAMRHILVDHARTRQRDKRGGGGRRVELEEALVVSDERGAELIALNDALEALTRVDPRKSLVVELRFFGGLSEGEVAEALGVSEVTVKRDWRAAKLWLLRELSRGGNDVC